MPRQAPKSEPDHTPAPRDPTPAQFAAFLEQRAAGLRAWDAGEVALYPFLAWLEAHAVAEQRERVAEHGTHLAALTLTRAHHNVIGICVAWALTHMVGRPYRREIGEEDRLAAFDLAARYWTLKNVMAEVQQGVRSFSARGRKIDTSFTGDALFDITDRLLDLFEEVVKLPEGPPLGIEALRDSDEPARTSGVPGTDRQPRLVGSADLALSRDCCRSPVQVVHLDERMRSQGSTAATRRSST